MAVRVLIVGCGYVGLAVGERLAEAGHQVFGLRRNEAVQGELESCGIVPVTADITQPVQLQELPGSFEWIVNTVSSSKGGVDEYRAVYLQGTRNLIEWLLQASIKIKKYIHTGSTSVYAQTDGQIVDEESSTAPASETGKILLETEGLLLGSANRESFPAVILRAAGIYGPTRGHLFQQFLRGEAAISADGRRFINMVHRDDLAGMIVASLERGRPGELYNAADDAPVTEIDFFTWLSQELHRPLPPIKSEAAQTGRKRPTTSRRVSNSKLKRELAYTLRYPTFREGYIAEILRAELQGN